jgi:hypothetical protein
LKLPTKKSSGKIALTIEHFHDSSKQKPAIKNFRFVVHFSSREFKIGCQVLFLTPCITHKIPEMQTRYKIVAGSVCGFPKFVTSGSGSGLGTGFLKNQTRVWLRFLGFKILKKTPNRVLGSGSKTGTGSFASLQNSR